MDTITDVKFATETYGTENERKNVPYSIAFKENVTRHLSPTESININHELYIFSLKYSNYSNYREVRGYKKKYGML